MKGPIYWISALIVPITAHTMKMDATLKWPNGLEVVFESYTARDIVKISTFMMDRGLIEGEPEIVRWKRHNKS